MKHLDIVLSRLKEDKLSISPNKCEFLQTEIKFLGLIVGRNGIKVDPSKVEILQTWPKPRTLTEVRSFIDLLQFFLIFIKGFSKLAAPLTNLTKKRIGISKWDEQCDKAFQSLKSAITTSPILVAPD